MGFGGCDAQIRSSRPAVSHIAGRCSVTIQQGSPEDGRAEIDVAPWCTRDRRDVVDAWSVGRIVLLISRAVTLTYILHTGLLDVTL